MNRITRIAALALSFAAAGSAFAESPGLDDQRLAASTLTAPRSRPRSCKPAPPAPWSPPKPT
jgi:hypothetical protein